MSASIYARVSTDDQTCENQLLELRDTLVREGGRSIGHIRIKDSVGRRIVVPLPINWSRTPSAGG
jgi:DNA invertase Pin-like site-specific DNA recombinase